ncbi:hypothetical protein AS888_23220 [Peribacillus simplex]|uniref:Uncharacterized protein n=1 Tax=Peribacillus simplex TaxID=1478 RepID=A0A109MW43_9BACI|nr:hypothetical protein AS888_23220 [Peribacillus simplex]
MIKKNLALKIFHFPIDGPVFKEAGSVRRKKEEITEFFNKRATDFNNKWYDYKIFHIMILFFFSWRIS